jgi:CNT family concentrative nucleoside transporter
MDIEHLSIKMIFGKLFAVFALLIGTPLNEVNTVGALLGTKFVLNEAIAFTDLSMIKDIISERSFIIATFALSGFANFTSVAIQISGIGEIAPNQRKNLARMGIRALIAGTLTSYISACMAAMLI